MIRMGLTLFSRIVLLETGARAFQRMMVPVFVPMARSLARWPGISVNKRDDVLPVGEGRGDAAAEDPVAPRSGS